MPWSGPERRWWLAALVWVVLIYATLYFARAPVEFLRAHNLLRLAVAAAFAVAAAPLLGLVWRRGVGPREGIVLALSAVVFAALLPLASRPEEKLHFLEYGLLGGMLFRACRLRLSRLGRSDPGADGGAAVLALLLAGLAGVVDESIQALLPNRYYDVRDIAFNVVASALVVLALGAASWARRRDRAP